MSIHFLVFGGTGAIGQLFSQRALENGHKITIFARNPSKVPASIADHNRTTVIQGDLSDREALQRAAECGASVFTSFAGPPFGGKGTPITDCYATLLPSLPSHGIRRALVLSTPSCPAPDDASSLLWSFGGLFMRTFSRSQYEEMHGVGQLVMAQPLEQLEWTVFRVGGLKDGPVGEVEATYLGSGRDKMSITRASVAEWVLREAEEGKWVGKAPYICNK